MKTDVKKTLILLGVVSIIALSTWAIQTRNAEGWFTEPEKEICAEHGTFIKIGEYASYGTCVCDPGYVGYLCNQKPPK